MFRSHDAGRKFPLPGAVADLVPKNIEQGGHFFISQIGNLDQRKLVKESLNFREHKVLCIPRLHGGWEDPGGNISRCVIQVFNIILNVVCFQGFWKVKVPAATD